MDDSEEAQPGRSAVRQQGVQRMVRAHFRVVVPYAPIIPADILSKEEGLPEGRIIKLDGNENPYGPSPRVLEALQRFDGYHIYPDPSQRDLRAKLGEFLGLGPEHLIAGNGSDEIIDLLMRLFLEPGDRVLNCSPSFGMYPFTAQVCGGALTDVPRNADFSLDVEGIVAHAEDEGAKLIFLASPNNPTGNLLSRQELEQVLATGIMVVVDEAYQEFTETASFALLVPQHENLAVLRTFSKWAGLAGLRVGYGVMAPALVQLLDQVKPPYNVNVAALVAAQASLDDREQLMAKVALLISERGRLFQQLQTLSFLEPQPSRANFILCRVRDRDAGALKRSLEGHGIFIKHLDAHGLRNAIRISVGKPEHTDAVVGALRKV